MKAETRESLYLWKRYWSIAHTSGRQTQMSCHNSTDAEGHAGSSSIKYNLHPEQPDEICKAELWIPTGDTYSWFIFLISYSPTNCAISFWRWVGNNWRAKLWFTQPIKESWDRPLDKSYSFIQSSWARTTSSSDNMAKTMMAQLTARIWGSKSALWFLHINIDTFYIFFKAGGCPDCTEGPGLLCNSMSKEHCSKSVIKMATTA